MCLDILKIDWLNPRMMSRKLRRLIPCWPFKFPENLCPFYTDHNQFASDMMWSLEEKIILPSPY